MSFWGRHSVVPELQFSNPVPPTNRRREFMKAISERNIFDEGNNSF